MILRVATILEARLYLTMTLLIRYWRIHKHSIDRWGK